MKNLFVGVIVFLLALSLSGCGAIIPGEFEINGPAIVVRVHQTAATGQEVLFVFDEGTEGVLHRQTLYNKIRSPEFGLTDERMPKTVVNGAESLTFMYGKEYRVERGERSLRLTLEFDNFASFAYFNGLTQFNLVYQSVIDTGPFIREQRAMLYNPLGTVFDSNTRIGALTTQYLSMTGREQIAITRVFVHQTLNRHSSANTDNVFGNAVEGFRYYFDQNLDNMIIYIRFPNTPAWYGLGVAATAVFMVGIYFILKGRQKTDK